jgi:hypothetical protein
MAEEDTPQRETDGALACRGCQHAGGVRSGADTRAGAPLLRHLQRKALATHCARMPALPLGARLGVSGVHTRTIAHLLLSGGGFLSRHATQPHSFIARRNNGFVRCTG